MLKRVPFPCVLAYGEGNVRFFRLFLSAAVAAAFIVVAFASPILANEPSSANEKITVFAAASMKEALEGGAKTYEALSGRKLVFSFASSGVLARQVEAGAPADVFISADQRWMDYAQSAGAIDPDSRRIVARNTLVLVAPSSSSIKAVREVGSAGLAAALEMALGKKGRLAIGEPQSVPAGRYGKDVLENMGLWSLVETRLAPMENVRVALLSVARGDTPLGVVYGSDAFVEPNVKIIATFPQDSHPLIEYPAALVSGANAAARGYLDFLSSSAGQTAFSVAGFSAAGDN